MTVFIVGETERQQLKALVDYAESHRISYDTMKRLASGEDVRDDLSRKLDHEFYFKYTTQFFTGFNITFSIEDHGSGENRPGLSRHLSMSSPRAGRLPHPKAFEMILPELGFRGGLEDCVIWEEEYAPGERAINVLQPY